MIRFFQKHSAVLRAASVMCVVGAMVTSVTYASLQSQAAILSGNSIQSATAGLLIGTASATSSAYSSTHSGFMFGNIVPGGAGSTENIFYLKNNGSAPLTVRLTVGSTPTNTSSVDLTRVTVNVTRVDTGTTEYATLQTLIDGFPAGGLSLGEPINPSATGVQYKISISMAPDAFNGTSASINAIDFVFTGVGSVLPA